MSTKLIRADPNEKLKEKLQKELKTINNEDIKNNNEKIYNLFSVFINTKNKNTNIMANIKSIFFIRILFSHLNEKIKLKLIKYNKNLQNKIEIDLINYKFYSGRYIIYETNIKGKEYKGYYHLNHILFHSIFYHLNIHLQILNFH